MAIQIPPLISQKAKKFGASESSNDFIQICLDSINYIISDINERTYQSVALVSTIDDSIALAQSTWQGLISLGLDYYISDQGSWTIQNLDNVKAKYLDKLKTCQMNYQQGLSLKYKFGDVDSTTG